MDDLLKLETETFNKLYTDYRLRFIRFAQTYIPVSYTQLDVYKRQTSYDWMHVAGNQPDQTVKSLELSKFNKIRMLFFVQNFDPDYPEPSMFPFEIKKKMCIRDRLKGNESAISPHSLSD